MAANVGTIRYHRAGETATFHVHGRGVAAHGLPMRNAAEQLLEAGVTRVKIDLRDCTYMDSTFLGTLLTIRKKLEHRHAGPLTLVAASTPCAKILHEMGLGDFIPASQDPFEPDAAWVELKLEAPDASSFRRNVVQAHEELAALPGPAGEQFQAVIRCMAQADATKPPRE